MPTHPSETSTDKIKRPTDTTGKNKPWEQTQNYGFSQRAEMDSEAEETEEQEYTADGLPRTQKYTYDKVGRSHNDGPDAKSGERKGRADCGC